jgi:UDPglucose 6-dehydrogenase
VTGAALASLGFPVVGLDFDKARVAATTRGQPPVAESGLADLLRDGLESGKLLFTSDPQAACQESNVLWVTFDTPVDDEDRGDVEWVTRQLDTVRDAVAPRTLVVVSSQVPVGYPRELARRWLERKPTFNSRARPRTCGSGKRSRCSASQSAWLSVSPTSPHAGGSRSSLPG